MSENEDRERLVVLRQVPTRIEADLIEALLRGAGIPCVLSARPVYEYAALRPLTTIQVRAGDLERAKEVIAKHG